MREKAIRPAVPVLLLCAWFVLFPAPAGAGAYVSFEALVTGLTRPVFVTHAGDGSGRLFIVEQAGRIRIWKSGALLATPFLNIGGIVNDAGNEQGLLGLAFHPLYETNGFFYVAYTNGAGAVVLARYAVSTGDADRADAGSGVILLKAPKPFANHNGGMLAFGPDDCLYLSIGDGGSAGDPGNNAQNTGSLLGKILRLDVDTAFPYAIPPGNPFAGSTDPQVRQEIWALGLRNAWRYSFDRSTSGLFIGDVGQGAYEEIDYQPGGAAGGANYGWRILEAGHCYKPATGCVPPPGYVAPVAEYPHGVNDSNGCSVTGGYVYRGALFPALEEYYFYGDYCRGTVWSLRDEGSGPTGAAVAARTAYRISSFGEGEDGELYLVDLAGRVLHLVEASPQTAVFTSVGGKDGYVTEYRETSGTGGGNNATATVLRVGDATGNRQVRGILSFGTGVLPDRAVIGDATLEVKRLGVEGVDPFTTHGPLLLDIRRGYFGRSRDLEARDFQATASASAVAGLFSPGPDGWTSAALPQSALQFVHRAGTTQVRLRFEFDDDDDGVADAALLASGNAAAADRPRLRVVYYTP